MIIKIFKSSGSATSAVNYVLSDKDWTGEKRHAEPKILSGDSHFTKMLDETIKNKSQNKCISGAIAFADGENLEEKQKQEFIKEFEKTFFGNMDGKVNCLYVEHKEKNSFHIHFIINTIDLESKKVYNPFPPGDLTFKLKDSFCALQNHKFGFNQIVANPLKTKYSSNEIRASQYEKIKANFSQLDDKLNFDKACKGLVRQGIIKNRGELINFIENEQDLKVHRQGQDYISVTLKGGKQIRLKGWIDQNTDLSYKQIKENFEQWKQTQANNIDVAKTEATLNKLIQIRNDYNEKRFKATPQRSDIKIVRGLDKPQTPTRSAPTPNPTPSEKTAQNPVKPVLSQVQAIRNQASQVPSGTNATRSATGRALGGAGTPTAAISAGSAVDRAKARLANAKTIEERIQAEFELAVAIANLNRLLMAEEEKKKNKMRI